MVLTDIRKYIFTKLIFSKVLIINEPGIIISKNFNRLSNKSKKMRITYTFEDCYVELYRESIKKLGIEKTKDLWYRIGKDSATRYFLFGDNRNFSKSQIPLIIEYFQESFNGVGMSVFKNVKYDLKRKLFVFSGNNNAICRKTKYPSLMEGFISGTLSFIFKENLEAKSFCGKCCEECKLVVRPEFKKRYVPNFSFLKILPEYDYNFLKTNKSNSGLYSFFDLLKFNLVNVDEEKKFYFKGKTILPSEFSLPEIFAINYFKIGEGNLFRDSIISFFKNFAKEFDSFESVEEKLKFFRNILSAFGYGETYFKKDKKFVHVYFLNPIYLRFDLYFLKFTINGILNHIYGKDFSLIENNKNYFSYKF